MAGLLDYGIDPMAMGLLGAGGALLTPTARGGGIGAALQAFPAGMMQGQEMQRRLQSDAQRQQALQQEMQMRQSELGMRQEKFGFEKEQYQQQQALTRENVERMQRVREQLAATKPDLLPLFDANPMEAMKRMFPEPEKAQVVAPGAALVQGGKAIFTQPKPEEKTAMQKALEAAGIDPASPQGSALLRSYAVKTATHQPAASQNVTMIGEKAESKVVGEGMGKTFLDIQNGAMSARGKINNLSRLESLMTGYETGKLTPLGKDIASYAASVGIKIDPNLGNKEAAESLSNEMALQMRNPSGGAGMPGAMSDADREFLRNMVPGLSKTPGGNRAIIETQRRLSKREIEVARLAGEYRKRNGTLDPGFYDELQKWSDSNPLFSDLQRAPTISPDGKTATGTIGGAPARNVMRFDKNGNQVK